METIATLVSLSTIYQKLRTFFSWKEEGLFLHFSLIAKMVIALSARLYFSAVSPTYYWFPFSINRPLIKAQHPPARRILWHGRNLVGDTSLVSPLQTTTRGPSPAHDAISSGPRRHFVNNEKNAVTKNTLIWQDATYPETISLRNMPGPPTDI